MTEADFDALDDFAGPGGWDHGAAMIGLTTYGIDHDHAACQTAIAAGYAREQADVCTHDSTPFRGVKGYIGSPSCTLFSAAGSGVGKLVLDVLSDGITRIFDGDDPAEVRAKVRAEILPVTLAERQAKNAKRKPEKRWTEERVRAAAEQDAVIAALMLEPARRIVELDPEWIALEQVREVLPLWQLYVRHLRARGYKAWAVVLCAADYGVPQTRYRAVLGASRVCATLPPPPTHSEHPDDGDLFGDARATWVSMGEALEPYGWTPDDVVRPARGQGMTERHGERPDAPATAPAPTIIGKSRSWERVAVDRRTNSRGPGGTTVPSALVPLSRPAPTLTGKSGEQWVIRNGAQDNATVRALDEPAPTILASMDNGDTRWVYERPATTVVGSFKPEVIAAPGYRTETSRQDAPGSVQVTVQEAGILQSFPPDYPWQGSRSKRYEQVGNAVPPLLAAHVLAAVTGRQAPT